MGRVDYRQIHELYHYGTKRHSGRYPWGSGERPHQHDGKSGGNYQLKKYTTPTRYMAVNTAKEIGKIRAIQYASAAASLGTLYLSTIVPAIAPLTVVPPVLGLYYPSFKALNKAKAKKTAETIGYDTREVEKLKDLKKKTEKGTIEEDLKAINPSKKSVGADMNCMNCVVAMEMRRRGYDVEARLSDAKLTSEYSKTFKDFKFSEFNSLKKEKENRKQYMNRSYNELLNQLEKYGKGSRGPISIRYDKKLGTSIGHMMYWENKNGVVTIYNPQGFGNAEKIFSLCDPASILIGRFDNLKVNESVTKDVVSRKEKKKR